MSEYYNRLKALNNNYAIGYRGYRYIGQVIIKRVVTFNEYETKFREFIKNNSYRSWSGYSMKFFKDFRENQNDSTVFVTFTNTRDHLDFIKTFDNALFGEFNGRTKNIYVRANGFRV